MFLSPASVFFQAIPVFLTLHNVAEVIICGCQKCFWKEVNDHSNCCLPFPCGAFPKMYFSFAGPAVQSTFSCHQFLAQDCLTMVVDFRGQGYDPGFVGMVVDLGGTKLQASADSPDLDLGEAQKSLLGSWRGEQAQPAGPSTTDTCKAASGALCISCDGQCR